MNGHDQSETSVLSLAAEARVTDEAARFDVLFHRFYAELYGLVYRVLGDRMEAEDTLQDTFLKLADEPALQQQPEAEVGAWLRRVSLNLSFNRLRSQRRAQARLERVGRLEPVDDDAAESPARIVVRREDQAAVREALADLPERQRE